MEETKVTEESSPEETPEPRGKAIASAALVGAGSLVFGLAMASGAQGLIMTFCPVGLIAALAGFVLAVIARQSLIAKIVIALGIIALLVGAAAFAFVLILAAGFSNMR